MIGRSNKISLLSPPVPTASTVGIYPYVIQFDRKASLYHHLTQQLPLLVEHELVYVYCPIIQSNSVDMDQMPQIMASDQDLPGRVAQLVGHLTCKSGVLGSIPGLATYFRFSFRFFKKGSCQLLAKVCA